MLHIVKRTASQPWLCLLYTSKAVNISGEDIETEIETDEVYASCEVTELKAEPEDENSMAEPHKVFPSVRSCGRCRIAAYSVNIFRFKK